MKWRDVLIGSIATLIVTILSGVAIFYITRMPEKTPTEALVYIIGHSASFESEANRLALVNVILMNQGDAEAKEVVGVIEFPFGTIKDMKIEPTAGKVSGFKMTSKTERQLCFNISVVTI